IRTRPHKGCRPCWLPWRQRLELCLVGRRAAEWYRCWGRHLGEVLEVGFGRGLRRRSARWPEPHKSTEISSLEAPLALDSWQIYSIRREFCRIRSSKKCELVLGLG